MQDLRNHTSHRAPVITPISISCSSACIFCLRYCPLFCTRRNCFVLSLKLQQNEFSRSFIIFLLLSSVQNLSVLVPNVRQQVSSSPPHHHHPSPSVCLCCRLLLLLVLQLLMVAVSTEIRSGYHPVTFLEASVLYGVVLRMCTSAICYYYFYVALLLHSIRL